jgi:hypothetical protein
MRGTPSVAPGLAPRGRGATRIGLPGVDATFERVFDGVHRQNRCGAVVVARSPTGGSENGPQVADDGPPSPRLANDDRKPTVEAPDSSGAMDESSELRLLFHRLNNEHGIILAHAELLEAEASDDIHRARAAQAVASVIDAMETTREIRRSTTGQ